MRRHRDSQDLDSLANAADTAAAGKRALTDELPVQRKSAVGAPPQLAFSSPSAAPQDPFGLHLPSGSAPVQLKTNGGGSGGGTAAASGGEREGVEQTIRMLEAATEHLGRSQGIDAAHVEKMLAGWRTALATARENIDTALGGDSSLAKQLRDAYLGAVNAARAAHPDGKSRHFIADHKDLIDPWGMLRSADANELIEDLSPKQRQKLQIVNGSSHPSAPLVSTGMIEDAFPNSFGDTTTEEQLDDVKIRIGESVPKALEKGLVNLVGSLTAKKVRPLQPDTTTTVLLDLRPHGGPLATFRFTFVAHKKGGEVLVELVSNVGVDGRSDAREAEARQRFEAHNFKQSGYRGAELEALQHAVLLIPDAVLSTIDGVRFKRETAHPTTATVGGHYDETDHSITMFDPAFITFSARNVGPDGEITDESVRSIVHELGHAVDMAPLRRALVEHDKTGKDSALEKASAAASGAHWEKASAWKISETGKVADKSAFRAAAKKDGGKELTQYSEDGWMEHYAECFSYYFSDPDLLKLLRPNVYAYFTKQFP